MKKRNAIIGGSALLAVGALTAGAYIAMRNRRTIPKGVEAVRPFDVNKFLGTWYEIARMDYRYEKNLDNTLAEYSMNEDGSIQVINRGFNEKKGEFVEAEGKAIFAGSPDEGKLKVSFMGPFYSGYNVIEIDNEYNNALIAGDDFKHLWLLSREPSMPEEVIEYFLEVAESYGYETSKLVWVRHDEVQLVVQDVEVYL